MPVRKASLLAPTLAAALLLGARAIADAPADAPPEAPPAADAPPPDPVGYLGLKVRAHEAGARVIEVMPGMGAEAAGLSEGDVILTADGTRLAGQEIKDITTRLKGPLGTSVTLTLLRFPGAGDPLTLKVVRGPAGPQSERAIRPAARIEALANAWLGALRRGEAPVLPPAAGAGGDPAQADASLIRALERVSGPFWVGSAQPHPPVAFWAAVGQDAAFKAHLDGRPPEVRLAAAGWLCRHQGSAALASALISALPKEIARRADTRDWARLAEATASGDVARVAATSLPARGVLGVGGWASPVGPSPSDLAALELASVGEGDPRPRLPAAVVARLEATGTQLPWTFTPPGQPFGKVEPRPAPRFDLPTPDGGRLALDAHPGPLVITFWATWCGPCRQEMPRLEALRKELGSQGLDVWGLSLDEDQALVAPFLKEQGFTLPVAFADAQTRDGFQVGPIPRTLVLDAQKRIVRDHSGYSEASVALLEEEARQLVAGTLPLERAVGRVSVGAPVLAGLLVMDELPTALTTDGRGGAWAATAEALAPLRLGPDGLTLGDEAVPLPFPADIARFVDLDGDGAEELLVAAEGGRVLRLQEANGAEVWSQRDASPLTAVGLWRDGEGRLHPVVVRLGQEGDLDAGGPPPRLRPRLEILGADGEVQTRLPLDEEVVELVDAPGGARLALVLEGGVVLVLGPDGRLAPWGDPFERVRGGAFADLDRDGTVDLLRATGGAKDVVAGAGGVYALTGAHDVYRLEPTGAVGMRLDADRIGVAASVALGGEPVLLVGLPGLGVAALK